MVIRRITIEPYEEGIRCSDLDGEKNYIIGMSTRFFQIHDPKTNLTITITTQIPQLKNPLTFHNEYLIREQGNQLDSLPLMYPAHLQGLESTVRKGQ